MKALLLKDIISLSRYMRYVLVLLLILSVVPGFSGSSFAVMFASMLPLTALAYDERIKWDKLAAMMPYTTRQLVVSKYVLGYSLMALALLLSLVVGGAVGLVTGAPLSLESLASTVVVAAFGLALMAVTIPLCIRFGVEQGRIILMIVLGAFIALFVMGMDGVSDAEFLALARTLTIALPVVTILLQAASIALSIRFYQARHM